MQVSPYMLIAFLIPCVCLTSVIGANADSLTLQKFKENTGTVSAVIGTLRFGCGAIAGPILAFIFDGSVLPIASLFLVTAILLVSSLMVDHFLSRKNNKLFLSRALSK